MSQKLDLVKQLLKFVSFGLVFKDPQKKKNLHIFIENVDFISCLFRRSSLASLHLKVKKYTTFRRWMQQKNVQNEKTLTHIHIYII